MRRRNSNDGLVELGRGIGTVLRLDNRLPTEASGETMTLNDFLQQITDKLPAGWQLRQ